MRIVLTGASRGLGRAMAELFIEQGHSVCGCARGAAPIAELAGRYPLPSSFEVVDVAADAEVEAWAGRVLSHGEPPELLINNAAVMNRTAPLWQVPAEEFSRLIDINIKGTANVIRHFLPAMIRKGRGIAVNFSSGWGRSTAPEVAPYCTSKWAVEGLTQSLSSELPQGMAAVPLNPGIIDTEMLRTCFGDAAASYPDAVEWARRAVPYILSLSAADNGRAASVPM